MRPRVIGVAGTAKNTGKTTAMIELLKEARIQGIIHALTSIGYDGESVDNVTGLPKPRIQATPGLLVAVASRCLEVSTCRLEILRTTAVSTPLGKIIIGRVTEAGLLVAAGPNKASDLRRIIEILIEEGAALVFVDGALNRMAPMVETDGLVLTTGAARTTQLGRLAEEAKIITQFFQLPREAVLTVSCRFVNILEEGRIAEVAACLEEQEGAVLEGLISQDSLRRLAQACVEAEGAWRGKTIVFSDAVKLLLSGNLAVTAQSLHILAREQVKVGVLKAVRLAAVTVNPYYPLYDFRSAVYAEAYVDKDELLDKMKRALTVPVYDILQDGASQLFRNIMA
ncbi:MAG: hypothetical protein RBT41_09200 [Clostridia bacterium]|jgi:hypothetical protein|nr:hypothetical protein [Clostridia bacterium]